MSPVAAEPRWHAITLTAGQVLAVLDRRMTQYREPVRFSRGFTHSDWPTLFQTRDGNWGWTDADKPIPAMLERPGKVCPYGPVGSRLWVREVWAYAEGGGVLYRADEGGLSHWEEVIVGPWRSPVQMARSASRMTLEVLDVRPERLQGISAVDARAAGATACRDMAWATSLGDILLDPAVLTFREQWDSTHVGADRWPANPWVWRILFRVVPR